MGRLEVEYVSGYQLVRGPQGFGCPVIDALRGGLLTSSWERDQNMDWFRPNIIAFGFL